jgi:two-component system NtrC family response regulator
MLLLRKSDELGVEDLPWRQPEQSPSAEPIPLELPPDGLPLEELQRQVILRALERHNWNQTQTADYLRIPRHVLLYRLEKFGLKRPKT